MNAIRTTRFLLPTIHSRSATFCSNSNSFTPTALRCNSRNSSISLCRPFCSTVPKYASESDDNLPPGMDKLMNNPEALSAISNLMEKMQENGIDLKSGERPSMAQLAKLAIKSDVREATAKVVEALQKAGIEISPEAMQQALGMDKDDGEKK